MLKATPKAIKQLSQLMGTKAALYFGNTDGSFWTDMARPFGNPPVELRDIGKVLAYDRPGNNPVIASAFSIPGAKWVMLVELSEQAILEPASLFLYWIIAIGGVLLAVGIAIAWWMSRNITRPLNQLTHATTAVAAGDYSSALVINRQDELGKLAASFKIMATKVQNAHIGLEKKVQARTAELEAANLELEAFSYSVSHDLRAPLRAVSGYANILKEDYGSGLDDEARRVIANILSNVKMMGQLIDDLIEFSRLGKKEMARNQTDMKLLVESCINELVDNGQKDRYHFVVGSLPESTGDPSLVRQVWANLLGNAIKYSSKHPKPLIEVGSRDGTYFVRDNGVGFDMKYATKLFKVFQRLHSMEEFEGTGIGLALTKRIINKHKGKIWAESSPGKGATFYFQLDSREQQDKY